MKTQINYKVDGITFVSDLQSQTVVASLLAADMGVIDGGMFGEVGEGMGELATTTKAPLMSSWIFVGGITAAVLAVSITLGILLAKSKIKKGFELYED